MIRLLPLLLLIHVADLELIGSGDIIELREDGPTELQCKPDDPNIDEFDSKWYKKSDGENTIIEDGDKFKIFKNNGTLRIEDPKKSTDEGDYVCEVYVLNAGAPEKRTIRVRGKPEFTSFKAAAHTKDMNSFNVLQDDDLNLICEVVLKPTFKDDIVEFTWFRQFPNGTEEEITYLNVTTGEELDGRSNIIKKSTLSLNDVKFEDRALYTCQASNGGIAGNSTVNVRVKDKLGALWPFIGIVAEVIILCTVICIYEKKRGKPEFEESENHSDGKSGTHSKMSR